MISIFMPNASAEDASFDGSVITVPVVFFNNAAYTISLALVADTNPPEFLLVDGRKVAEVSSEGSSSLLNQTLTIPALQVGETNYRLQLAFLGGEPLRFRLSNATANLDPEEAEKIRKRAVALFETEIETNVIQNKCAACHVGGGLARDTRLQFYRSNPVSTDNNFDVFRSFLQNTPGGRDIVLSKVAGGNHAGGVQLPERTAGYNDLANFLTLLGEFLNLTPLANNSDDFFSGVTMHSREETLRRAAIIAVNRLPTSEEVQLALKSDEQLRVTLRGMMEGDGFHQFLLEGVNDRLLTEGAHFARINPNLVNFPAYRNKVFELQQKDMETNQPISAWFVHSIDQLLTNSIGELVAHVVENDLPYSEVLTADYMMMNPVLNNLLGGTATFEDERNVQDFQPGIIDGYYIDDGTMVVTQNVFGMAFVEDPGTGKVGYPHAGILSSPAFLARYPTTATNRNRARARWTLFHFLDIDIENSSQRPMDAEALADTNNPTLNNPNCTACHQIMDPVAGAFQNWDDMNQYSPNGGALDGFYKNHEDGSNSLYEYGDSWYRDMRPPGLFEELILNKDASLIELAQLIVKEPGFAKASVKFWWPSIIGSDALVAPIFQNDDGFVAQLNAFNAQNLFIDQVAQNFAVNFDLKDMLVDLIMSDWFGASSVDSYENLDAHTFAELGSETLLTSERLHRKTLQLTGFSWRQGPVQGEYANIWTASGISDVSNTGLLSEDIRLFYGGINSFGITKRSTEITPLMSSLAMTHALESSCPIVLKEFSLANEKRKLFFGITGDMTPDSSDFEIRRKLVELHKILHGKTYSIDSVEIKIAYDLLVDTWVGFKENAGTPNLIGSDNICDWWADNDFAEDLDIPGEAYTISDDGTYRMNSSVVAPFLAENGGVDYFYMKKSWVSVMVYMMTHYFYLYE